MINLTDGLSKGLGNSRKLKSSIAAGTTHEQLVAMLCGGTLPVDLGIDPAGWAVPGDPVNHAAAELLQADIRTATVRAGESIKALDVVNVEGGEAFRDVVAVECVENVFDPSAISTLSNVVKISEQYSVVAASYAISDYSSPMHLISNADGKKVADRSLYGYRITDIAIARLTDTTFAVHFNDLSTTRGKIGTINGASITFGTEQYFFNGGSNINLVPLSSTQYLGIYNLNGLKARIYTVSGVTITQGAEYALSGNTGVNCVSACLLASGKVGVCYSDQNGGWTGKAVIATVNGTTVTFGASVKFDLENKGSTIGHSCVAADGNMYVAFNAANEYTAIATLTVNGDQLAVVGNLLKLGVYAPIGTTCTMTPLGIAVTVSASLVFLLRSDGAGLKIVVTYDSRCRFIYQSVALISDDRILLCYAGGNNNNYGTATILTILGDKIAGSFVDNSRDAIALTSGTGGDAIQLAYSGTVSADGVTEGQRIDSPGVSAYAPRDGWLKVLPEAEAPCVEGVYTGNGKYTQNDPVVLDLGFTPSCVEIVHIGSGGYPDEYGLLSAIGQGYRLTSQLQMLVVIPTPTGFKWWGNGNAIVFNMAGTIYRYKAFR